MNSSSPFLVYNRRPNSSKQFVIFYEDILLFTQPLNFDKKKINHSILREPNYEFLVIFIFFYRAYANSTLRFKNYIIVKSEIRD